MSELTDALRDIDRDMSIDERYDAAERIDELEAANEDLDMVAGLRQARIDELEAALREKQAMIEDLELAMAMLNLSTRRALGEHDE